MDSQINKTAPFIIGLTGVIGTGKSLVRKMLEHLGAQTIDADRLAHGAYTEGTDGYHQIIQCFGDVILYENRKVDRRLLGKLVFNSPQALHELEAIIHPLVSEAVSQLVELSPLPIIIIEAIRLFESDLKDRCSVIWKVTSPVEDIYRRLEDSRGMSRKQVDERLSGQSGLLTNQAQTDVIISNEGNIDDLYAKITIEWNNLTETSKPFFSALSQTQALNRPFQDNLIQLDNRNWGQAFDEFAKSDQPFLPAEYFSSEKPLDISLNSTLSDLDMTPYRYFLWQPADQSVINCHMISDIENFYAAVSACAGKCDADQFTKIVGLVADFSSLRLCETLIMPFNRENIRLGEDMGFSQWKENPASAINPALVGYNLLYKQLRPQLNLFRKN